MNVKKNKYDRSWGEIIIDIFWLLVLMFVLGALEATVGK